MDEEYCNSEKTPILEYMSESRSKKDNENGISSDDEMKSYSTYIWKIIAIMAGFLCICLHVLSAVCVQLLERKIPDFELNAIRCGTGFILFSLGFLCMRRKPVVPRKVWFVTACYGAVGFVNTITTYTSVTFIPLTSFQALKITVNITSGIVIFAIFLKEKIDFKLLIFSLLCSVGVVLVIQPGFIFITKTEKERKNHIFEG